MTLRSGTGTTRELIESQFPAERLCDVLTTGVSTLQEYQSYVLRVQVETLRRLKYRPTGGFCFSSLADPAPNVSASILDHERTPKDAYVTVQAACAAVIIVGRPPAPIGVNPGRHLASRCAHRERSTRADRRRTRRCNSELGRRFSHLGIRRSQSRLMAFAKIGVVAMTIPDTLGETGYRVSCHRYRRRRRWHANRYTTAVTLPPD